MLKRIILGISILVVFTQQLHAQNAPTQFEFSEDKHDFGVIEEGVNALWDFKFKNTGKDTIRLQASDVRASCGCTTPNWTKEAILPGKTGIVSAQFSSSGRVGVFNKNVTVTYGGAVQKILTIKGVVIKKDSVVKYSDAELKKSAKMILERTSHNFGKVERSQKIMTKIAVKNTGKDSLFIKSNQSACYCITAKLLMDKKDKTQYEVKNIPPGKSGYIELVYASNYDGANTDIITLFTNDLTTPRVSITLSAEVVNTLQEVTPIKEEGNSNPFK